MRPQSPVPGVRILYCAGSYRDRAKGREKMMADCKARDEP